LKPDIICGMGYFQLDSVGLAAIQLWGKKQTTKKADALGVMSLFYQQPGLAYPAYPPVMPIPGHAWHGIFDNGVESVRESLQSSYMGDTFPALCQFWKIVHKVTLRYYRDIPPPRGQLSDHVSLSFAEYKYRELIAWARDSTGFYDTF